GWLCQAPHCRRMGELHEHHREFRSSGGCDALCNLVTLCKRCHDLVHAGKLVIRGTAPYDLTFLAGVTPGRDPDEETYEQEIRVRKRLRLLGDVPRLVTTGGVEGLMGTGEAVPRPGHRGSP